VSPKGLGHVEAQAPFNNESQRRLRDILFDEFLRHGEIYPNDTGATITLTAAPAHHSDEFPAGYSLTVCSPALPASASPAGTDYAPAFAQLRTPLDATRNHRGCVDDQNRLQTRKRVIRGWVNDHENPWVNDCENPQFMIP
jgi:hypothetical protein